MDVATELCFLINHGIKACPRNWQVPPVLLLSTMQPTKLEFK